MKQVKCLLLCLSMLTAFSCSDGAQIAQKVSQLIEEHKIESMVIETTGTNGLLQKKEYPLKDHKIENQFIQFGGEYINLGKVQTIKVNGSKLELRI